MNFLHDLRKFVGEPELLVTVVQLPTGAYETAVNTSKLNEKLEYIVQAYDSNFCLKANPQVRMVAYILE